MLLNGVVGGGAEAVVGRLVSRVSSARLWDVKIRDFPTFANNLIEGLGEQGARCQQIMFRSSTASDNRDQIVTLGNTLRWTLQEDDGNNINVQEYGDHDNVDEDNLRNNFPLSKHRFVNHLPCSHPVCAHSL